MERYVNDGPRTGGSYYESTRAFPWSCIKCKQLNTVDYDQLTFTFWIGCGCGRKVEQPKTMWIDLFGPGNAWDELLPASEYADIILSAFP